MPCYTVQTNTIDVPKMNATLRARALAALGATVQGSIFTYQGNRYYFTAGRLAGEGVSAEQLAKVAALVKKHYSDQVVRYTAQRNGWTLKQTAPFQYEVIK